MKKLLIISPYFPPVNAADMQRIRMSLSYFTEYGWQAEVVTVNEAYTDIAKDELLMQSLPSDTIIHKVKALNKSLTSRFGLGSIALRSLPYYFTAVNKLLKRGKYDLIYFSTTQFPVCILGTWWRSRFGVPYVIDMQDPWHTTYYKDKPRHQRPRKYWFSYRLNRLLEPVAMRKVGGLISVSGKYIQDLKERYPQMRNLPATVIPFGAFYRDLEIALANRERFAPLLTESHINIVYIGRGGVDLYKAIIPVFKVLQQLKVSSESRYQAIKMHFIGTSYAAVNKGSPSIMPLAAQYGLTAQVSEHTERISYYHALVTLQQADALFIPGSDDPGYTASKLYPYLLTQKLLLAIFHPLSPATQVLDDYEVKHAYSPDTVTAADIVDFLEQAMRRTTTKMVYNEVAVKKYSAQQLTLQQCELLDQVIISAKN